MKTNITKRVAKALKKGTHILDTRTGKDFYLYNTVPVWKGALLTSKELEGREPDDYYLEELTGYDIMGRSKVPLITCHRRSDCLVI